MKVIEAGSFSAVAKETHVSTSTVARKISQLEGALGVPLLHRSTHKISLTEAGNLYLERATTLIADFDDTMRVVAELDATPAAPSNSPRPSRSGAAILHP